ncbi:MAG: hypothetical protein OXG39_18520 [Chloroflexi bacterium]|nr:hypothetical protein [Chloroflexota bacterium]
MIRPRLKSKHIWLLLVTALLLVPTGPALAANITVDEDCSLYNAILSANGEEQVEPLNNCEDGDEAVDAEQTGVDTITIALTGTEEGTITLTSTLSVTSEVIVDGAGFVISGDDSYQIFNVDGGSLEIMNLTATAGSSASTGGAISVSNGSFSMNNSVISNSASVGHGAGIYAETSDIVITNSAISANTAGTDEAVSGAGIYFAGGDDNSLLIDKSGLDSNSATDDGAGLYVTSGNATISNTSFAENSAADKGGAIYNAGTMTLTHVTIVDNSAEIGGGIYDTALLHLYNSILSGNDPEDCSGTLNSNVGNLIQDGSCGHEELVGDPMLLKLAGLPVYYVLQEASPAIDSGNTDKCMQVDQRGLARLEGLCDIGASEYLAGSFSFQIQSAVANPASDETEDSDESSGATTARATATPTCESLPDGVTVTGYVSGTQCQERDAAGVGNQVIIDYGFKKAIDLWGYVPESGLRICFQDTGTIILLDASTSPRTIIPLSTVTDEDWRCTDVDREGTAVLMNQDFLSTEAATNAEVPLTGCTVTTTDILNVRNEPAGDTILARLMNNVSLASATRTSGWFKIDYYGIAGWISADYVETSGDCQ